MKTLTGGFTFNFTGAIILLSGVGLIVFTFHVLYINLKPTMTWKKTSAIINGSMSVYDDTEQEYYEFETAIYLDDLGNSYEAVAPTSSGKATYDVPAKGNVTIYYNPSNPAEHRMFLWRNFLGLIMLPFGLFLVGLGYVLLKK